MGDAATSRMALPGLPRPSLRPPAGIQPAFGRSGLSLPVPTQRKSGSLLDYDASSWPAWKQRWLVFDSDEQQDEYRADRMVPAYFKLFGIGSLMTALVVALDMARELGAGTATPARIAVSSLAIVAYLAVVLHTSLAKPEVHSGRRTQHRKSFLFRHGLEVWLAVAMVLTCIPEYLTPAKVAAPPSTMGGYMAAFFVLIIADYTGNGLLFPWNVLLAALAFVLQLSFSIWASESIPSAIYTHLSPILSAILIAWPSFYANDRLQRISYLNWIKLEQERTESVEAKSRLDNQLTLMFPQAILPALRADFESGNHGVIAKSIKSAAVIFVEFGGRQLKDHMLSSNVDQAAKAVKVLNCIFVEVDNLLATSEFNQIHKIKTLGSKVLLAGGLFSSWSKSADQSTTATRRESLSPRVVPDLVRFLQVLYLKLYRMNVEIVDLLDIKAGMHIGPLVVGIVGNTRFYFDVYGDTINCSSRMMDLAKPGELAFGEVVWNALQPMINCRCLGMQQIKGKGIMEVFVSDIESPEQNRIQAPPIPLPSPHTPPDRSSMAVSFSTADVEDIDRPLSALFRRMSTNMRTRAVSMVHRMQAVLWVFMKRFRRLFNFKAATWADSKAAYTAETIATMPAGQYLGHLGSYLRRIPQGMVRRVLFGEMNGWLLRFRNENLEGIYRGARIQGSHRSVLVAISMGIAASVSTLIAAVFHVWGSMTAEQLRTFWTWDGLFAADGFAVVWTVVGGSLQLLALFWTWAGAEAERRIPNPHDALMELTRRPPEWTPREGPRPQPEDSLRSRSWQVPLFRALTLLCAAPGFTLLQTSVLLLAGLDHRGYVAATAQLVAFFTLTIPTPGGAFFGEAQCLLGWGLVGVSLGWSAAFGKVDAYEGMQAFLLSSVSVITSVINKQVEREDFLMQLVSAKHSLSTGSENERSLKFLECLVPSHVVPYLLSVPRKEFVERLDMETVMFMDICGFTTLSSMMEPYAVIRMLNAIFYEFDQIIQATEGRIQKITTIGDAYVASTISRPSTGTSGTQAKVAMGPSSAESTSESGATPSAARQLAAESATLCCRTALAMQEKLAELHTFSWFRSMLRGNTVVIRIGLHTADVLGAVLGSRYEVIGNGLFVAEKVQEGCKPGGVAVSERTLELLGDVAKFGWKVEPSGRYVQLGDSMRSTSERPSSGNFLASYSLSRGSDGSRQ